MALGYHTLSNLAFLGNYAGALERIKRTPAYARGNYIGATPICHRGRSFNHMRLDPASGIIAIYFYGNGGHKADDTTPSGRASMLLHPCGRVDIAASTYWAGATTQDYLIRLFGIRQTTSDHRQWMRVRPEAGAPVQWAEVGGPTWRSKRSPARGLYISLWIDPTAEALHEHPPVLLPQHKRLRAKKTHPEWMHKAIFIKPTPGVTVHRLNRPFLRTERQRYAAFMTYANGMASLLGWGETLDENGVQVRSRREDATPYKNAFGTVERYVFHHTTGSAQHLPVADVPNAPLRLRGSDPDVELAKKFLRLAASDDTADQYKAFLWLTNGQHPHGYRKDANAHNVLTAPRARTDGLTRAILLANRDKALTKETRYGDTLTKDRYGWVWQD